MRGTQKKGAFSLPYFKLPPSLPSAHKAFAVCVGPDRGLMATFYGRGRCRADCPPPQTSHAPTDASSLLYAPLSRTLARPPR